jgi:hypothetical protein
MTGNGTTSQKLTATMTLEMDLLTHTLKVTGDAPNIDTYLAMLQQATRTLELQARAQAVAQLQQQAKDAQLTEAVRRSINGG